MTTTTTIEIASDTRPVSVKPEEMVFNEGERFSEVFTFHDSDGSSINMEGRNISLDLKTITIEFNQDAIDGEEVVVKFDKEVSDKLEEGIIHGTFIIEWSDYLKKLPSTFGIKDPQSTLPLQHIRGSLLDEAAKNNMHGFTNEFSDMVLLKAKERSIGVWNSQPGRHRRYTVKSFPEKWIEAWTGGIIGEAFLLLGRQLLGNVYPYESEGLSVQAEERRMESYTELGMRFKREWIRFCKAQQYYNATSNSYRQIG